MNTEKIKIILSKEVQESIKNIHFKISVIINILIFTGAGFFIIHSNNNLGPIGLFASKIGLLMFPAFSMWLLGFPFIQEKFWNEKVVKGFQSMLTLPVSLKDIWLGKILAIFLLSYPFTFLISVILIVIYFIITGLNPINTFSLSLWLLIFLVGPFTIMIYNVIASWITLRFDNPRTIDLLQYISIGIVLIGFISINKVAALYQNLHLNNIILILGFILILSVGIGIINYLFSNLDKEKAIN